MGSAIFAINDLLTTGAAIAAILGLLSFVMEISSHYKGWFASPNTRLCPDDKTPELLSKLTISRDYEDAGYCKKQVPHFSDEYVVRSIAIDNFLRNNDVALEANQNWLGRINEELHKKAKQYEDAIRCHYRKSRDSNQLFINEAKTCLGQDLLTMKPPLQIYRGTYFHSFLTNDLVVKVLESKGSHPSIQYQGSDDFPVFINNGVPLLKPIGESLMGNHIGTSTIAYTRDGQLVFWRQSESAQQSRNLLVPTGSGSCDWSDWEGLSGDERTLKGLVCKSMQRELMEESTIDSAQIQTEIIGFYRWVRRGGKPEFVGISKVDRNASDLEPNAAEVDAPKKEKLRYPAATVSQLQSSIEELLEKKLSVPLWANLTCIKELLDTENGSEYLKKFLGLQE